jgi:hypothetical protein
MSLISLDFSLLSALLLAMGAGASIRITLTLVKQRWASTYHHTMSYILLPMITFVITKVITGNIALSLGMIGALSIVRFRNPVKNPLELVLFFALITIGISMSVNTEYGVLLTAGIIGAILTVHVAEKVASKFDWSIFSMSFDEGQLHHVLEVSATTKIENLDSSEFLVQKAFDKSSSEFFYRLMFSKKDPLNHVYSLVSELDVIVAIEVKYV